MQPVELRDNSDGTEFVPSVLSCSMCVAEPKRVATAYPAATTGAITNNTDYGTADDVERAVPVRFWHRSAEPKSGSLEVGNEDHVRWTQERG